MEMYQNLLLYPEVFTDLIFVSIPTCPLELRAGIEKCVPKHVTDARTSDRYYTGIIPQNVRLEKIICNLETSYR